MESITKRISHAEYFDCSKNFFVNAPVPFPDAKEPTCIFHKSKTEEVPEFSIVMPIHNQQKIIQRNLTSVVQFTGGTYEMILIVDGCSDSTEKKVLEWAILLNQFPPEFYSLTIIKSETPLFETAADNLGFFLSRAPYCLEIQADMQMTEKNYNLTLLKPFQLRDDVIGVSGRCCHMFNDKCRIGKPGPAILRDYDTTRLSNTKFYINETCNRGPLLLDRLKLKELGYLDQSSFFLGWSEHDLFCRALLLQNWICGYVPINFSSPLEDGSMRKPRDPLNAKYFTFLKRRERENTSFLFQYLKCYRPKCPDVFYLD